MAWRRAGNTVIGCSTVSLRVDTIAAEAVWRNIMTDTIVVIAAGEMGAGIGKRLSERGAHVLTSLKGRGAGSAARAKDAGMTDIADDNELVANADFVLSVVPPGQALAL